MIRMIDKHELLNLFEHQIVLIHLFGEILDRLAIVRVLCVDLAFQVTEQLVEFRVGKEEDNADKNEKC